MKQKHDRWVYYLAAAVIGFVVLVCLCGCEFTPVDAASAKRAADLAYNWSPIPGPLKEAARPLWDYLMWALIGGGAVVAPVAVKKVHTKLVNSEKGKLLG